MRGRRRNSEQLQLQTMKFRFSCVITLLLLSGGSSSQAAEPSCHQSIGPQLSAKLAEQCRLVSPATRPPCNVSNACSAISEEIDRGCGMLRGGISMPSFCTTDIKNPETISGTLISGGGIDDLSITIFTADGRRIQAYCVGNCGDWFARTDGGDETVLSPRFAGRTVVLTVAPETNRSRIVGPSKDEKLIFVKQVRLNK